MFKSVCLRTPSGCRVGRDWEEETPGSRETCPHLGSSPAGKGKKAALGFLPFFTSPWRKAGISIFILLCGCCSEATASVQDLSQRLAKTQNPREPLEFYKAHLGSQHTSIAANLLKDLSRGCTAEVPLPHAPWPGSWPVCLAQHWLLATSFIPFFANIELQRSAAPRWQAKGASSF